MEGVIDVHYASLASCRVQHRVFYLDGHPSRYQPRPTGLNCGEQTGTGVFPLVIAVPYRRWRPSSGWGRREQSVAGVGRAKLEVQSRRHPQIVPGQPTEVSWVPLQKGHQSRRSCSACAHEGRLWWPVEKAKCMEAHHHQTHLQGHLAEIFEWMWQPANFQRGGHDHVFRSCHKRKTGVYSSTGGRQPHLNAVLPCARSSDNAMHKSSWLSPWRLGKCNTSKLH